MFDKLDKKIRKMSRRDMLKLAGIAGAAAVAPTVLGVDLMSKSRGEYPQIGDPYTEEPLRTSEVNSQPILILYNASGESPFDPFMGEILLAEGINSFEFMDISNLAGSELIPHDIVLLCEGPLNSAQADILSEYVFKGGCLVVMYPENKLLPMLGLKSDSGDFNRGYIMVDSGSDISQGIVTSTVQYHGKARKLLEDGAEVVAWLCDAQGVKTGHPAVTLNRFGQGWAGAWVYDLAASVVLTRQGNPDWANQERDGFPDVRPVDMFYGWLDLDRIEIPQADEQQRLLVNMLNFLSDEKRPLPRLWYFPAMSKSMLVATSDAHMNPAWAVETVISRVEKFDGHISIYYLPPNYSLPRRAALKARWWLWEKDVMDEPYLPTPIQVANWRERGHEFGLHAIVSNGFEKGWKQFWNAFTGLGYGPVSPTSRVHRVLWDGWIESARLQSEFGIRMNLDFYHVGDGFRKPNGEWVYGHFTGSGLPMKFIDAQGNIINIYQQLTHLADDHILNLQWGGSVKIPAEQAVEVSKALFDRSLAGGYAAIGAIFHTDPYAAGEKWANEAGKWFDGTMDYVVSKNIPIWSSEKWLSFTTARHDSFVDNVHWAQDENRLSFDVEIPAFQLGKISMLLPLNFSGATLSGVEVNGKSVSLDEHSVGSQSYGWFIVESGKNSIEAFYA